MQRGVPLPTDLPIVESRKRPAKERGNQLSQPRCHQEIPEIIHRKVSSVHLSENQITICHLFLPPQRHFAGKQCRTSTVTRGQKSAPPKFCKKLYVSQNRQRVAAWLDQSKLLVRNPRKPKEIATKAPRSSATPNAMRRPDGCS